MIISKKVIVKWNSANKKRYKELGYAYTKTGDEFEVHVSDLSKGSKSIVEFQCDYCGIVRRKKYEQLLNSRKNIEKDCCDDRLCCNKKFEEVSLLKYGTKTPLQTSEVKNKIKETNLDKYGVENVMQNKEVRLKAEQTNISRYGFKSPMQNEEIMNKKIETNIIKYGFAHPTQNEEVKEKMKDTNLAKYGYEYASSSPIVREKVAQTNLERYGTEHAITSIEIQEKVKNTWLENYGVDHPFKSDKVKDKIRDTNIERYGVPNPFQSEIIKEKIVNTNIEKYGFPSPMQNEDIKSKAIKTLYENGNIQTSSQQLYVYDRLKELGYDVVLNEPVDRVSLDVALYQDNVKIDIEYDGWYWHQDSEKDKRRDYYVKSKGWKIFRIKSASLLPSDADLINSIELLVNNQDRTYTETVLSDYKDVSSL